MKLAKSLNALMDRMYGYAVQLNDSRSYPAVIESHPAVAEGVRSRAAKLCEDEHDFEVSPKSPCGLNALKRVRRLQIGDQD
jgi:hypothetical protein